MQYGRRVDRLITSEGWRGLKGVLAEEGVVSIPYLRKQGASSRVYSFLKSYLLLPETACEFLKMVAELSFGAGQP